MDELIKRLEAATGPDRELDALICEAAGYTIKRFHPGDQWHYCVTQDKLGWNHVPRYTASVDAAMTLVPEDAEWSATTLYRIAMVEVGLNCDDGSRCAVRREDGNVVLAMCTAAIEHLAAALRARQP